MDISEYENLNPEQQEHIFHKSSFRDKGELLMRSHNPAALARSLSCEELYLVTRGMDIEERGEVVKHASLPQIFFISDIDCWKKDRLDGSNFLHWLEVLLSAGDDKLLVWLMEMDYEAIVTGFQQVMKVVKPDHEWTLDEVLGDLPYFTIDQMYYIGVDAENLETIKRALEVLFVNHKGRYIALLEGVLGELTDEVEEDAYQKREMRLAERGFPDFETAQKIYRPISREELEKFPKKTPQTEHRSEDGKLPNYIVAWSAERFFLDDVLHSFQDDLTGLQDRLQEELAWISNKVIACEGIDLSSEEKVRHGIERARGFINIGLESLAGGTDLQKARQVLSERWMEVIFRWGMTQVLQIKEEAQKMIREKWNNDQIALYNSLEAPYDLIFVGLFRQTLPICYDAGAKGTEPYRDFRTLEDVRRIRQVLEYVRENFKDTSAVKSKASKPARARKK
jgi:hypothetical protein